MTVGVSWGAVGVEAREGGEVAGEFGALRGLVCLVYRGNLFLHTWKLNAANAERRQL